MPAARIARAAVVFGAHRLCENDRALVAQLLDALEADHEFLLAGEVFKEGFINDWINQKRYQETELVNTRPHPYEYELYLDV